MKYRDLIQFEPLDDVIQLREADDRQKAEQLVSTYVISDRMVDVLLHRILPGLRIDRAGKSSGLFIVGNYGTGKSHLMSVLSSVAEHGDLLEKLTHPAAVEGVAPIAGKFKVIRQEFGGTSMSLRDVIFSYIDRGLSQMGIVHYFPSMDESPNAKDPIVEMMSVFQERYPDYGLLIVVDELLDFLRSRNDRELVLDLAFLREVGEICGQTRLRFIAGLQESLFDSPRFQFAADSIRRVKDRFEQVRIARDDVAYVVSRRLLNKTQAQRSLIRQHLQGFTRLYDSMAERMEDFVELFPVHPAYLEIFELVTVIEKRQVLKALSQEMRALLDRDVPTDEAGLISFDSYWELIKDDASYRTIPEIRDVLKRSQVLEDRVSSALGVQDYKPAALRIIHALSLHRLTVGDLKAPVGLTPKELRDRLCLYILIPEPEADFLLTSVESVLAEISKTMSGQFISHNRENDQYYLDLEKVVDYDALIAQRAESLDEVTLDRYFFDLMARSLELTDSAYVPGFRIWQRELPWLGQGITRQGYIFLGAPNERSTAQPPRDFYLHVLALFSANGKSATSASPAGEPDEVFFSLAYRDKTFDDALRLYAGAREMSAVSSGANKEQYERKADGNLRMLVIWLRENLARSLEIRYRGELLSPSEIFARYRLSIRDLSVRDAVFRLAAACLGPHFQQSYPEYPRFAGMEFTAETMSQGADAALRAIAGGPVTRPAQSVLEALQVARVENSRLSYTLEDSLYACQILEALHAQPEGNVLNRGRLLKGAMDVERSVPFGLEPPWLLVVLMTLVRQGEITLNLPGRKVDSDDLEEAARLGVAELAKFTSISRPKALPEAALKALFAGLDLPEGWVSDPSKHEVAVQQLRAAALRELENVTRVLEWLRDGLRYWREPVLSPDEVQDSRQALTAYKEFLDGLQHLSSPGRLRNFSFGVGEVRARLKARSLLAQLNGLNDMLQIMQPHLDYIYQVEANLSEEDLWQAEAESLRERHLETLRDPAQRVSPNLRSVLSGGLANLRSSYGQIYVELHNRARLNTAQDARKKRITTDRRWVQLKGLAALEFFFAAGDLQKLEKDLNSLRSCPGVGLADLKNHTTCALCGFSPRSDTVQKSAGQRLEEVENRFEMLYTQWISALRTNLDSESARANIPLLGETEREAIEVFSRTGDLPERITQNFISALADALRGLERVTLDGSDFLLALSRPGMPCNPTEFEARFRRFLAEHLEGKDPSKVRIQLDW